MGLFSTLNIGAEALSAYTQALTVAQNNVSNASTPGYATQLPTFEASSLQLEAGLPGGVSAGNPQSTRNEYLEQAVRTQAESNGNFTAQSQSLSSIEPVFDVTGQSGIDGALNNLFQSFSAWSANPSDPATRQAVIANAQDVADSFQQASSALAKVASSNNGQINSTVQEINTLAAQIQGYNAARLQSPGPNAGLDAQVHSTLETLAGLANVTAETQSDGTVTLLLGGQTPLLIGTTLSAVSAGLSDAASPANPNAPPDTTILDSNENNIAGEITGGTLGGLLHVANTVLPSLQGDGSQTGALNQLAKQVADRVNQILEAGQTSSGQPGVALFSYDSSSGADVARTLALNSNATAANLAEVDPGPPAVSNGTALTLSNLGESTSAQDTVNGQSILGFYAATAANVGSISASATSSAQESSQALAQAQAFRDNVSGVSLDAEAVRVQELQTGYQAASKLIATVAALTQTLMTMVAA
jgi:flagellar hook-associated protein 1